MGLLATNPDNSQRDESIPERVLQELYHKGDGGAFTELWRRHEPYLRGQAIRLCFRDDHRAKDALQNAGVNLSKESSMESYDPSSDWRGFAYTILRNVIITENRRRGIRTVPFDPANLPQAAATAAEAAELNQEELREALRDCLTRMSVEGRWLLTRIFYEGALQDDLAKELGIDAGNVTRRKIKSLGTLRDCLTRKGWEARDMEGQNQ